MQSRILYISLLAALVECLIARLDPTFSGDVFLYKGKDFLVTGNIKLHPLSSIEKEVVAFGCDLDQW